MPSTFEVRFVAAVPALGIAHYTLMYGTEGSVHAVVQYINQQVSRYARERKIRVRERVHISGASLL